MTKQKQRGQDGNFLPCNTMWAKGLEAMRKPKIFKTPEDLLKSCIEYFEWCNDNPFMEAKNLSDGTIIELPKMRVTSIQGLQVFLGIRKTTWEDYCARPDYKPVTEWVEKTIWDRKFSGAASGFFNASIISREMGLEDHQKISSDMTVNVIDSFEGGDSDEK